MLQTVIHAVAASPLPSGELESPDPGVGEAEVLFEQAQVATGPRPRLWMTPEELAELKAWVPNQEAADEYFARFPVPDAPVEQESRGKEEQAEGVAPGDSPDGAGAGDGEAGDGGKKSGQPESPAG